MPRGKDFWGSSWLETSEWLWKWDRNWRSRVCLPSRWISTSTSEVYAKFSAVRSVRRFYLGFTETLKAQRSSSPCLVIKHVYNGSKYVYLLICKPVLLCHYKILISGNISRCYSIAPSKGRYNTDKAGQCLSLSLSLPFHLPLPPSPPSVYVCVCTSVRIKERWKVRGLALCFYSAVKKNITHFKMSDSAAAFCMWPCNYIAVLLRNVWPT